MFANIDKTLNNTDKIREDQYRLRSGLATVVRMEMELFMEKVESRFHMIMAEIKAMKWAAESSISSLVKQHKEVIDMFRDENTKLK